MSQSQDAPARQSAAQPPEDTATRHLCAGAYLDLEFQDMVIRKVHNDASRRVAPSYGFDLVAVMQHAWRGWTLEAAQQACILAVLFAAVIFSRPSAVIVACAIAVWYLAVKVARIAPELMSLRARATAARAMRRPALFSESSRLRELSRMFLVSVAGGALLAVIAVMVGHAGAASLPAAAARAAVFLALVLALCGVTGAARQIWLNSLHRPGSLRRPRLGRRLETVEDQQDCDYVVYRRSPPEGPKGNDVPDWEYEPVPFTGAGKLVHRWLPPLGVQLLRPGDGRMEDTEHVSPPFQAHELVEHLKTAMEPIGKAADPTRMRGFRVRDRLYITEADVPADRDFLQGPRKAEEIDSVIDDAHGTAQHYLEMRVTTTGEVVTTAFLRVTVRGRSLSLDFATCALTRAPDRYHKLDEFGEGGIGAVMRSALRGMRDVPVTAGRLWRLPGIPWVIAGALRARKDRTITPRRGKMIGTMISVREEAACDWKDAGHDKMAIYDEMKIIEKRILRATQDFLESRDVDTSMFKRLTFSIINSGVLNMGKLEIGQAAVGTGAQFHNNAGQPDAGAESPEGE